MTGARLAVCSARGDFGRESFLLKRTDNTTRTTRVATLVVTGAAAAAAITAGGTGTAHADGVWDRVAQCESGGNWGISTGNGFSGGLQFTPSTWRAFGGTGSAQHASKSEQIRVAKRVLAGQGPGAWPVCSKRAGLTRANGGADGGSFTKSTVQKSTVKKAKKVVKTERRVEVAPKAERRVEVAPKAETAPKKVYKSEAPKKERSQYRATKRQHVAPVQQSGKTITVRQGDTLSKLADRHGVDSWRALYAANKSVVSDPNLIFVGQVLHLPA